MNNDPFYILSVDHSELAQVLLSYFGNSEGMGEYAQKYIKRDNPGLQIVVLYNKNGGIKEITYSSNFPEQELQILRNKIKDELIDNQSVSIGQEACFSIYKKVEGYFRYKDLFHIIPVPENAPKPPFIAAYWPFLLQFKYTACSNVMVSMKRRANQLHKIVQLLHFFSKGMLCGSPRYTDFAWVTSIDDRGNAASDWRQIGYTYEGGAGVIGSFTPTQDLVPINREPYRDFYNLERGQRSDSLTLPDNLEALFDLALNLDTKNQARFNNACNWYYVAKQVWSISHSASYAALITALEALIERWEQCKCGAPTGVADEDRCEDCGEPRYRVIKTFKQFLDTYVPNINELSGARGIYDLRSKILHGVKLFHRDKDPMNFIDKRQQDEDMFHRAMFDVVFTAIFNWLNIKA